MTSFINGSLSQFLKFDLRKGSLPPMEILLYNNTSERTCNCINKEKRLVQGKSLTNNIIYKATLTSNQDTYQRKIYYDITKNKFKQRYANHIKTFWHEKHQSNTELSNELWSIKDNNYAPNIVWEILQKHQTYNPNTKRSSLCLNKKLEIGRYKVAPIKICVSHLW